jgi:hypothetical protein
MPPSKSHYGKGAEADNTQLPVAIKHLPFWEEHSHPAGSSLGGV